MRLFGRKMPVMNKKFALKAGNFADVYGRKALNTAIQLAPIAAYAAGPYAPAVLGGVAGLKVADKAIRLGVDKWGYRPTRRDKVISFGNNDMQSGQRASDEIAKQTQLLAQ